MNEGPLCAKDALHDVHFQKPAPESEPDFSILRVHFLKNSRESFLNTFEISCRPRSGAVGAVAEEAASKGNSKFHGARPVHQTITIITWFRISRLSIKNSLALGQ